MRVYLLIMLVAAGVTFLAVPLVRRLARASGALTAVRERDVHTVPIPRLGGIGMLAGVIIALVVASQDPFLAGISHWHSPLYGVLTGGVVVGIIGVIDDIWGLDWLTKLCGQVLAAFLMAWMGVQLITLPIAGVTILSPQLSLVVTVIFTVACMNAVNFVDGLDGLAAGMIAIGSLGLFLYSYGLARFTNPLDYSSAACVILAATLGACLGFLAHNFHPATIFMGDTGSMLLGLISAGATIMLTGQVDPSVTSARQVIPVFLPILLPFTALLFPLMDMVMAVFRRIRAGKSPFLADGLHLHHRILVAAAGSQRNAVLVLYVWTASVAIPAALLLYFPSYIVALLLLVALACSVWAAWVGLPGLPFKYYYKRRQAAGLSSENVEVTVVQGKDDAGE